MVLTSPTLMAPLVRRHSFTEPLSQRQGQDAGHDEPPKETVINKANALRRVHSDSYLTTHLLCDVMPLPASEAVQRAKKITIPPHAHYGTPCLRGHYYPPAWGLPLRAMVVIVPGTGQSAKTYAGQAYHLSQHRPEGIGVVVCNKMGHGDSDGTRGVFHDKEQIIGNVALYVDKAREIADETLSNQTVSRHTTHVSNTVKSAKDIPLLIYGQSLGGMLAAYTLAERSERISEQWSDIHALLHNPWLKLQERCQPQPWQEMIMAGLAQLNRDSVICRSGSLWSTLYANFLAAHHMPQEHSLIGIVAFNLAQHLGQALCERAEHIRQNIAIVLSDNDEVVNPDHTEAAFLKNVNARIFRWHNKTLADHNQNITPLGALMLTEMVKNMLFKQPKTPFLLEPSFRQASSQETEPQQAPAWYEFNLSLDASWAWDGVGPYPYN
jgi:alpha-beta hydrolase superfamily lysophospholipase